MPLSNFFPATISCVTEVVSVFRLRRQRRLQRQRQLGRHLWVKSDFCDRSTWLPFHTTAEVTTPSDRRMINGLVTQAETDPAMQQEDRSASMKWSLAFRDRRSNYLPCSAPYCSGTTRCSKRKQDLHA